MQFNETNSISKKLAYDAVVLDNAELETDQNLFAFQVYKNVTINILA